MKICDEQETFYEPLFQKTASKAFFHSPCAPIQKIFRANIGERCASAATPRFSTGARV